MSEHEIELFQVLDTVWITVNNISVRVEMTSEGVVCDMYALRKEDLDEAHLAACYAFFSEAEEKEEDEENKDD